SGRTSSITRRTSSTLRWEIWAVPTMKISLPSYSTRVTCPASAMMGCEKLTEKRSQGTLPGGKRSTRTRRMVYRRSYVPTTENELSALQRAATRPYVDLAASNPTLVELERPNLAAVLGRYEAPYEPDARGLRSARAALAELYAREGRGCPTEDDFVLSASTSEGYAHLMMALCDPGDAVAIPEPSYPLFEHLARLSDVRVQRYRLAYDGAWHIDFDSLRRATDERTRAIFVVSPNNPTGSVLRRTELHELWRLGLPLVVDEVFRTYPWPGAERLAAEPLAEPPVLTFLLDGLSKRLGAPELKLAWTVLT